ncbi:S-locus lectin protein kinase family protein [Perilla frutescens var. hirtella]|nr:S-locus lectin protein kinase family protein [Perilla frutescens var. hirtella]
MAFNHHKNFLQPQLSFLIFSFSFIFGAAIDAIRANESLSDGEALISNGNRFKLSFFSPPNSSRRYVGIMYNLPVMTVVWVANRDKPLNDSTGTFQISSDGNLVILDGRQKIVWLTKLSASVADASALLLNTGNLVLKDNSSNTYWESFNHASDSWLEQMKISTNLNRNEKNVLTSWRSPDDPTPGSFTLSIEPLDVPQSFIWKDGYPYARSGPWNGQLFTGVPHMKTDYDVGANVIRDSQGTTYLIYSLSNSSIFLYCILTSLGNLEKKVWSDKKGWDVTWSLILSECDMYGKCGPFGSCNAHQKPICSCFHGFVPKNTAEWEAGNWTSGCMRKTRLQCEQNNSMDGFLKVEKVKVPDHFKRLPSLQGDCRGTCLRDCSCIAYADPSGIGCLHWTRNLTDAQVFTAYGGDDLYIRLASSELAHKKNDHKIIIATAVVLGFILVAVSACLLNHRARKHKNSSISYKTKGTSEESMPKRDKHGVKLEELSLFKFQMLSNATEKFELVNKLGQGGFGPVYRGQLPNGQKIAVKRLASSSNQGVEEFMNEVEVISRLQHRNLVKLLGCCVESEEKMLVYEYMPNGSLDAYLFDSHKQEFLDWPTRKLIIEGICRGLLYLHRDSRLKIIHRDLKASNILLDEELSPKISDFGMARIFGGKGDQANTNRVVGTYGYMSPEYALQGIFSEKSDVYSFGVLLLEIVSGKKNSSFYDEDQHLFLIAYAWKLWNDGKIVSFMEPTAYNGGMEGDIVRYANVGLLCVQETAADRPNISIVLSMLSCEIVKLPHPNQPAFLKMQISRATESSTKSSSKCSANDVTISVLEGR